MGIHFLNLWNFCYIFILWNYWNHLRLQNLVPQAYRISAQFQRCQILKAAEVKVLFFRCVSQSWGWVWVKMENSRPWGITTTDKDNRRHAFLAKADISSLIWESHLYFYNTDVIHKNIQWKSKGKSLLINLLLLCCSKFENTTY